MSAVDQAADAGRPRFPYAKGDDPYADSPDCGDDSACGCGGAWHFSYQHCVDWPCPGCTRLCPLEPGLQDVEDDSEDVDE